MHTLYSTRPNLQLGFHGCDRQLADDVVLGKTTLLPSTNDYDWLGWGVYFWENNIERAQAWANEAFKRGKIKEPAVLGSVIDLGFCLDLMDSEGLTVVKNAYESLVESSEKRGEPLPRNVNLKGSFDYLLRKLDCAVIQMTHRLRENLSLRPYDSVRSMFQEGGRLYEGAGFCEKNHVQICVCNPNCIKGYFLPREMNEAFPV